MTLFERTTRRSRTLRRGDGKPGPVVYWMSRDQRAADNWALLHAQALAMKHRWPLAVLFCLVPRFLDATARQYGFMMKGLREVESRLEGKDIPFFLVTGDPAVEVPRFLKSHKASALVMDFDPLKIKIAWKEAVIGKCPSHLDVHEVDAHNVVPCWQASPKQEYGAYTLRPRIARLLPSFLEKIPSLRSHPVPWSGSGEKADWRRAEASLDLDRSVGEVRGLLPGEAAASRLLRRFLSRGLGPSHSSRNDPSLEGQSGLSPYLHFGQLSAQRVAIQVSGSDAPEGAKEAFLEELIVRRELADNFCFYNRDYDAVEGFPRWARETLAAHARDPRPTLYARSELENAKTHDDLWNAAQRQMVLSGRMHGYLRMYWAKKILEWSRSPAEAMRAAICLNDRYELDGRDPNGYAGIAWSIGGVHDRAWGARPIFGKVRTMTGRGIERKYDLAPYLEKWGKDRTGA